MTKKEKIIRLIELLNEKAYLETHDKEREEICKSNSYAINEGYRSYNMERIEEIEKEIDKIDID